MLFGLSLESATSLGFFAFSIISVCIHSCFYASGKFESMTLITNEFCRFFTELVANRKCKARADLNHPNL